MKQENCCQELFVLTIEQYAQTAELGIPLDALFLLECLIQGTDPAKHIKPQIVKALEQTLTRKGLISGKEVTLLGKETYDSLLSNIPLKKQPTALEVVNTAFEAWWSAFPVHDGFELGMRRFQKTRALRTGKEVCKTLFERAVKQGPYTAEQIVQATAAHISSVKQQSLREGKNKLSFVNNSQTYLRQKVYEAWVGDSTEIKPVQAEQHNNGPINLNVDL